MNSARPISCAVPPREAAEVHRRRTAGSMRWTNEAEQAEERDQQRNAEQSAPSSDWPRRRLRARVQQHDDEDEQHHDGARIDDHLRGGDELGAQQQVQHRQRAHDADQRKRARDGCVCTTTLIAHTTAISAKMRKRMTSMFIWSTRRTRKPVTSRFSTRDREQELPGEAHQLVVTEARQRAANPDEDEQQESGFGREPEQRQQNRSAASEQEDSAAMIRKMMPNDRQRDPVDGARGIQAVIERDQSGERRRSATGTKLEPYCAGNSGVPAAQEQQRRHRS